MDQKELGTSRREGLLLLLRVAEQAGTSITIRETLILVALALTAGMSCEEVQVEVKRKNSSRDFRDLAYFQVLFDPPLNKDQRATLSLLDVLARLDPGTNAIRSVDEALITITRDGLDPDQPMPTAAKPNTRREKRTEDERHRAGMAVLRRRDFFDLRTDGEWKRLEGDQAPTVLRAERLGFKHHKTFEAIIEKAAKCAPAEVRDKILCGLEAIQDVRRGKSTYAQFAVVDPAYGNLSGLASILSQEVPAKRIEILPQSAYWDSLHPKYLLVTKAVDWVDRRVTVRFRRPPGPDDGAADVYLNLDLLQFEFVMRSAQGLTSRGFFQGDIRRITARLNLLAKERETAEDMIKVVCEGRGYTISVDKDSRIICEDK
ncbi:hypothetical protein N8467_01235 [bacterium]|nr:hypothetical protein [bacterium]